MVMLGKSPLTLSNAICVRSHQLLIIRHCDGFYAVLISFCSLEVFIHAETGRWSYTL